MQVPSESFVDLSYDGPIARITLNRPAKRNALTWEFLNQLLAAVTTVRNEPAVRALVLAANGPAFCAGMDLAEMEQRAGDPRASELWGQDTETYRDLLAGLFTLPMPTLAVVEGPAVAGGLGLVLACDLVLATEGAFFALPEPQRGITAAVLTPLLNYRIGTSAASFLLLSGQRLSAAESFRVGLSHAVVAPDKLAETERALTASILSGAPGALATSKRQLIDCAGSDLLQELEAAMRVSAEARATDEAREGLAAFLEKRKPKWQV